MPEWMTWPWPPADWPWLVGISGAIGIVTGVTLGVVIARRLRKAAR